MNSTYLESEALERSVDESIARAKRREKRNIALALGLFLAAAALGVFLLVMITRFGEAKADITKMQAELKATQANLSVLERRLDEKITVVEKHLENLVSKTEEFVGKSETQFSAAEARFKQSQQAIDAIQLRARTQADEITAQSQQLEKRAGQLEKTIVQLEQRITQRLLDIETKVDKDRETKARTDETLRNLSQRLNAESRDAGARLLAQGKYQEAADKFTSALGLADLEPAARAELLNLRALAWHNLGTFSAAIDDYSKAIELQPDAARSFFGRAESRLQVGGRDEALRDLNRSIQLDPKNDRALVLRGDLEREGQEDYTGALRDYGAALEINPANADALRGRGRAYRGLDKPDEAIKDFDAAIQLRPDFADAYFARGIAKQAKKDLAGAIADFTHAHELADWSPLPLQYRSAAKEAKEDFVGAIADVSAAIERNPGDPLLYLRRGLCNIRASNYAAAEADLRKAADLETTPEKRVYWLENVGLIYLRTGEWQKALDHAKLVEAISPAGRWNKIVLAIAARKLQLTSEAATALGAWLRVKNPTDASSVKVYLPPDLHPLVDETAPSS